MMTSRPESIGAHFVVTVPIKTPSTANLREFWATKARRVKAQRQAVYLCLKSAIAKGLELPPLPVVVTLIRMNSHPLDSDNVQAALKGVRDEVAKAYGVDDRGAHIEWRYAQARGRPSSVVVSVEPQAREAK